MCYTTWVKYSWALNISDRVHHVSFFARGNSKFDSTPNTHDVEKH